MSWAAPLLLTLSLFALVDTASAQIDTTQLDSADGYARVDYHRFPIAADGIMIRYRDPTKRVIDVFFYPFPAPGAPHTRTEALSIVRGQADLFLESVRIRKRRGDYDDYRVAFSEPDTVISAHDTTTGYTVGVARTQGDAIVLEFMSVYALRAGLMKVRSSVPKDHLRGDKTALFTRDIARRLSGS